MEVQDKIKKLKEIIEQANEIEKSIDTSSTYTKLPQEKRKYYEKIIHTTYIFMIDCDFNNKNFSTRYKTILDKIEDVSKDKSFEKDNLYIVLGILNAILENFEQHNKQ